MPGHYLLNWRSYQGSNRRAGLTIQITSVVRRQHIIASIESWYCIGRGDNVGDNPD